jgi:hypothetical protein
MPESSRSRWGVWVSLVFHLVLLLVVVELTRGESPWRDLTAQDPAGPPGGGGGREIALGTLPAYVPPAAPRVRAPAVVPRVVPPVTITRPLPLVAVPPAPPIVDSVPKPAATGGEPGTGGGAGGGAGTGTGPGSGPGSGAGTGVVAGSDSARGRARPPESTRLILPPFDYPGTMRGLTIDVNFFVLADGRVERVVFIPEVPDRGYARKLEEAMRAYRFRPARDASGQAIPGIAIVKLSF